VAKIAYLGTGNMGQGMIPRLLQAGHSVTAYNRTREKAQKVIDAGATFAATPREAVKDAEIVFASVIDDNASRNVWTGPDGALAGELKPGVLLVECSTLSHDWLMELVGMAKAKKLRFLDCPVAGRPNAAAAGTLVVFAGGDAKDLDEVRPMLQPLSKKIYHFGPNGAGLSFKLIYNLMGATQVAALAEGLLACEAAGIDLKTAAAAFAGGATGSPHVIHHAPIMAEGNHENPPQFTGRGRLKDSTYGVKLITDKLHRQSKIGSATVEVFKQMVDFGMSERNDSELVDALIKIAKSK
jgi:3-hydroxyisobutyrate dehydrogenase